MKNSVWWKILWGAVLLGALGGMTYLLAFRAQAVWTTFKSLTR